MYLIDPATGTQQELIHNADFRQQHDTDAFTDCPGPLNLEAFDVHGISLAETAPRRFSLYTTSHGEREAIEIYELDLSGAAPLLVSFTDANGEIPTSADVDRLRPSTGGRLLQRGRTARRWRLRGNANA